MIQTGIALLFQTAVFLQQRDDICPRHTRFVIFHHPAEVRHIQRAAADHYRIAAGGLQTGLRALVVPDFAVGDHRNGEAFADLTDRLPVYAIGFVAIFFSAAMHHQFIHTDLEERLIGLFREFTRIGLVHIDEEDIEPLVTNIWLVAKFWFAFEETARPREPITEAAGRRGAVQVLALFKPYIAESYLPTFRSLIARYQ